MKHKKYDYLPSSEKYLLVESSGTVNKKKIYRSKKSNLQNIKNEIQTFGYHKNTHYMNNILIRNKNTNNLLAYMFCCLNLMGKVKIDYYSEMSEAIKEINNTKFNCLYITPSIYWNFKDKINLKHYEYIFLAGEQLSKNVKETLLNSTNAKVFDMYGGTDSGLVAYKNIRNHDYHTTVPSITLVKNMDGKIEFLRENSGACDFIEDENGLQDLRLNKTFIGGDFIEFIDDHKFNYIGRDSSFIKINESRIYLEQVKNYFLNKLKPIDIQLLPYKDENNFDQFCMYLISEKEYENKYLMDLILEEYNSIIYMPKKVLTAKEYLTKNINSGELIKTDTKKLLQLVLENGKQTY
jgi:acyl-coenzyme A synthetase/AMP-(fatty) acid ligase